MVHPHFLSAILNEPWALSEESALSLSPIISNIFDPNIAFEPGTPTLPSLHTVVLPSAAAIPAKPGMAGGSASKTISVISLSGPLMKNDQFCGPAGMKTIGAWIQDADRDPNVDGIMLVIDSPGGTVNGTEELGSIIKGTGKPVVAFVDDLAASAAYWLACNADEIIANNSTAQVGSIGVLLSFMDIQPALEKQGVVFHTITAPQSSSKTTTFDKLRAGDYEEYKNKVLAPLADKFINIVKANRPDATDDQLTGKVFFAQDALGTLIDNIATFNQALNRVAELCDEKPDSLTASEPNPPSITMNKPKLDRLAKAVSVDAFESVDGSIALTAEQAVAVEAAFEDAETQLAEMQSQLDTAANLTAKVSELEAELQTANERIAELSTDAGSESATVITETEANTESVSAGGDFWSRYNRLTPKSK